MSGERLRAELERIAEGAPRVDIPDDLYARGRRATARARVLAAGAAVACVALLVAVLTPALQTEQTPVAGKAAPAVPDHIHAVPDHVDDRQSDLQIGLGAAAFVTQTGIPVVVSAMTGEYHLLDLEGVLGLTTGPGPSMDNPPVALSPDGRYLAWGWADPGEIDTTREHSGIRIADLETGAVEHVSFNRKPSSKNQRIVVNQLTWSPNGKHLAWGGTRVTRWTETTFSSTDFLVGVVAQGAPLTDPETLPEPMNETSQVTVSGSAQFVVAVSDDGGLSAISPNLWWRPTDNARFPLRPDQQVTTLWSEGDRWFTLVHSVEGDEVAMVRELPDGQDQVAFTLAPQPRMLGVLGDGTLLLHQGALEGLGQMPPKVEIVTPDAQAGEVEARTIIDVDEGVLGLTLAYDLIDPDHPTVERPVPDWPWSTERKLAVGGLVLLGLVLLGGVVLGARRLSTR